MSRPTSPRGRPRTDRPATTTKAAARAPEELLAEYRPDLDALLGEHPTYRKRQVFEHMMHTEVSPFAEATSLPANLRRTLDEAGTSTLEVTASRTSSDGTEKLLLVCKDGAHVETVVMPYRRRTTACISSQAGCPVGCAFCATGAAGFRRNLSSAEIIDQVRAAAAICAATDTRLSNIVYMGMGEPLLNLNAVLSSIRILTDPAGMGLGHRSVSISTVGIPKGILRLAHAEPQVNLALSLHAASDKVRELLIPSRHRHPLKEVLDAAWQHFEITHRKLFVEYVMLRGINDSPQDARRLADLLRGHVLTVNLLAWNPVYGVSVPARGRTKTKTAPRGREQKSFEPSPRAAVMAFKEALLTRGIEATVRASRGVDIEGACGQLAGRQRSYGENT